MRATRPVVAMQRAASSRNEVEGVWQLVGPFGESTVEIAHLVADVDDDRVPLVLKLLPLWRLEIGGRFRREVVRLQDQSGPLEPGGSKIRFGRRAQTFRASGEKEHVDATIAGQAGEGQHRPDRLRPGHPDPGAPAPRSAWEIARAGDDEAVIVRSKAREV